MPCLSLEGILRYCISGRFRTLDKQGRVGQEKEREYDRRGIHNKESETVAGARLGRFREVKG